MRIEAMRYFAELAQAGSFYAAADRLSISQQGLNKSITQLEHELDARLLERSRSGVRLTDDGQTFLKHARSILAEYDRMLDELLENEYARTRGERSIPIYVSYYAANIAASDSNYVSLLSNSSYIELSYDQLVERARQPEDDELVFLDVHGPSIKRLRESPDLVFDPVIATRCGVVYHKGHAIGESAQLRREDVCDLPIALNTFREMRHLTDWLFAAHPLTHIRLGATSPRMLLECVATSPETVAAFDSYGFFLSQLDADMPTADLEYRPLETPDALCFVGFLASRRAKPSPRTEHARRVLRRYLLNTCGAYFSAYPTTELWRDAGAKGPK